VSRNRDLALRGRYVIAARAMNADDGVAGDVIAITSNFGQILAGLLPLREMIDR